jgi:hypothetical protein
LTTLGSTVGYVENVANTSRDKAHSITDLKTGVLAGLFAGLVLVMLEMALVWIV